jgi:hypothetical protein
VCSIMQPAVFLCYKTVMKGHEEVCSMMQPAVSLCYKTVMNSVEAGGGGPH